MSQNVHTISGRYPIELVRLLGEQTILANLKERCFQASSFTTMTEFSHQRVPYVLQDTPAGKMPMMCAEAEATGYEYIVWIHGEN